LPGATTSSGVRGGHGSASTLTVDDARAIPREAPAVERVSYMVRQLGQVEYESQNWTTNVQGVTPEYVPITHWTIAEGRALSDADEQTAALVVLIGHTVAQQLFGAHEDPLGATILVKGFPRRVVGVLAAKGQSGWGQDQDDLVMIPFATAEGKVLGVAAPSQQQSGNNPLFPPPLNPFGMQPRLTGKVNAIYVQARGAAFVPAAGEPGSALLHARPRLPRAAHPPHGAATHRRRVDLAPGRRHRHHEHPAGVSHGAHARDRDPHGDRRPARARAPAVPRRGGATERGRRRGRHPRRRGDLADHLARRPVADAPVAGGHPWRVLVLGGRGHLLRLLPGAEGGAPRFDRGGSLRVAACANRFRDCSRACSPR